MTNVVPFARPAVPAPAPQPAPAATARPAAARVATDGRRVFVQRVTSAGVVSSVQYPSRAEARRAVNSICRREGAQQFPEDIAPPEPHRPGPGGHAA